MEIEEEYVSIIRSRLIKESIKFWLPPYTDNVGNFPHDLVERYSKEFGIPSLLLVRIFQKLQNHALAKLKAKDNFKSTGIATLFLHIVRTTATCEKKMQDEFVEMPLKSTLSEICIRVKTVVENSDDSSVRMIFKGRILKSEMSLEEQGVTNSSNILVLLTNSSTQTESDSIAERASETRTIAEALSKRKDGGTGKSNHFYLELNDQHGNKIFLPEDERQSLCLAMTLHEKGRSLLKSKEKAESLLIFLEADAEFKNCRAEILKSVDNYAILNLDIVWCYFCLKRLDSLPDAEQRLQDCKACFTRTYGSNFERLTLCKGSEMNELALYVRLHILEAVCHYLRGQMTESKDCLNKAESLLLKLHVDDNKLSQLISMGYTPKEARLSLRSCGGDLTIAVDFITRKREELFKRDDRERKEKKHRKEAKKYQKTAANELVNIEVLNKLIEMGFDRKLSLAAVQHSNNDLQKALQVIQNEPEVLYQQICSDDLPPSSVEQFIVMGFSRTMVEKALRRCSCDVNKCMNELIKLSSKASPRHDTDDRSSDDRSGDERSGDESSLNLVSSSSSTNHSSSSEDEVDVKVQSRLGDLSTASEDDYLNLTLDEERELINKYRLLIANLTS